MKKDWTWTRASGSIGMEGAVVVLRTNTQNNRGTTSPTLNGFVRATTDLSSNRSAGYPIGDKLYGATA